MPQIPDCYDPVRQEEQRQVEWDRLVELLPVCTLCKRKLMPEEKFHFASCQLVCTRCMDELNENTDIVEVSI